MPIPIFAGQCGCLLNAQVRPCDTVLGTSTLPFPPEPFAWIGIQLTRWSLVRHDRTGKRTQSLRTLDRLGLGFDS